MSARSGQRTVPQIRTPQGAGIRAVGAAEVRRLQGALDLPIDQIRPDRDQPRRDWQHDDGDLRLADLTRSIEEFGILQPLLVGPEMTGPDGIPYYPLIAGNRRLVAAQGAGLLTVPALVRDTQMAELRVLQLTENLQRQALAPLDEGRAYRELMDLEGISPPQLAAKLHVSETMVRNRLHLLDDQALADAVARGQISASAARQILQLPDEERSRFRALVAEGVRVRTNDLAAARARLNAAGVSNPRRSPRPPLPLAQPATPAALAGPDPQPLAADPPMHLQLSGPDGRADGSPAAIHAPWTGTMADALPANLPPSMIAMFEAGKSMEVLQIMHDIFDSVPDTSAPAAEPLEGPAVDPGDEAFARLVDTADPGALELLRRMAHHGEADGVDTRLLPLAVRLLSDVLRYGMEADLRCGELFELLWGPARG